MTEVNHVSGVIFTFQDKRVKNGKGKVFGPCNQTFNGDENFELRAKFHALFLGGQAVLGVLFRLPYHLVDFFSGASITRGTLDAEHEFRILRVEKSEKGEKVHRFAMKLLMAKHILFTLVKDIVRLAFYPIAMVGLQISAFCGLFLPLDFRLIYGGIENFVAPDLRSFSLRCTAHGLVLWAFYSAPCMQTREAWDRNNLYRIENDDNDSPRSLRLLLENDFRNFAPYFGKSHKQLSDLTLQLKPVVKIKYSKKTKDEYNKVQEALQRCLKLKDEILAEKDRWIDHGAVGVDPSIEKTLQLKEKLQELILN